MKVADLKSLLWPEALIWLLLLALLVVNVSLAHLALGVDTFIRFGIAAAMALLLAILLMQLRGATALVRLAAIGSIFWLVIFFTLTFVDFLTRG